MRTTIRSSTWLQVLFILALLLPLVALLCLRVADQPGERLWIWLGLMFFLWMVWMLFARYAPAPITAERKVRVLFVEE